jgi:hypothetical protein
MNAPKRKRPHKGVEPSLPFDVTQDIDPALVDHMLRTHEPTLTQADFDELTVELPKPPPPRR